MNYSTNCQQYIQPIMQPCPRRQLTKKEKVILSIAIYLSFIAFGLSFNIFSSTLIDIVELTSSSFSIVSIGIVLRSIAYCIAALVFGVLYNYANRQIVVASCIFVGSLAIFAVPFMKSVWLVNIAQFVLGVVGGAVDVGMNAWILEIWEQDVNPWMQALHFSYGIGLTIAPFITEPFLLPERDPPIQHVGYDHDVIKFAIPFIIGSVLYGMSGIFLMILHKKIPYVQQNRTSKAKATSDINMNFTNGVQVNSGVPPMPKSYVIQVVTLGSFFLCFYNGIEITSFTFLVDFAYYSDLHLSKSTGTFMLALMSVLYTVCRGIGIVIASLKVRSTFMLYGYLTLISIGNGLVFLFGNSSAIILWISAAFMGAGYSCVFPTTISFLEERINVTNTITGCFLFASSVCVVTNPIIIGYVIERIPMIFAYVNVASFIICLVIFVVLHSTDRQVRRQKIALYRNTVY